MSLLGFIANAFKNALPVNTVYQILDTVGDASGTIEQAVDGSSTPVEFIIKPASDEKYILKRLNLLAIAGNFNNAANYGSAANPLTTGIDVFVRDSTGIILNYTAKKKITRSHDWGLLSGVDAVAQGGAGSDPLLVRWTFSNGGDNLELNGKNGEELVVKISDNMTSFITSQIAMAQGTKVKV
jgi:hypothetical protein